MRLIQDRESETWSIRPEHSGSEELKDQYQKISIHPVSAIVACTMGDS